MLLGLGIIVWAQRTTELKMMVGDTLVWQPFDKCDAISYSISGPKFISFQHLHWGEKIEIIAREAGNSSIIATCSDNSDKAVARIIVSEPYVGSITERPQKPETQVFTAIYNFIPPRDNFYITITDPDNHCCETFVKVGDNEAYNDGHGTDRFWNIKTGKNWYYRPDAQGWTDDVDWEFEPFEGSFFPLNAFANEVDKNDLSQYYIGM